MYDEATFFKDIQLLLKLVCVAYDISFHLRNENEKVLPGLAVEHFEDGLS